MGELAEKGAPLGMDLWRGKSRPIGKSRRQSSASTFSFRASGALESPGQFSGSSDRTTVTVSPLSTSPMLMVEMSAGFSPSVYVALVAEIVGASLRSVTVMLDVASSSEIAFSPPVDPNVIVDIVLPEVRSQAR